MVFGEIGNKRVKNFQTMMECGKGQRLEEMNPVFMVIRGCVKGKYDMDTEQRSKSIKQNRVSK